MSRQKAAIESEKSRRAIGKLAIDAALILMRIPTGDVRECGFNAKIGLEQLRDLLHIFRERAVGVVSVSGGSVCTGIRRAQHAYSFEGCSRPLNAAGSRHFDRTWIQKHRLPGAALGPRPPMGKVLDIADC